MKDAFIARHTVEFAVSVMCRALEVSVSGYYIWRARTQAGPSAHAQADTTLSRRIRTAFLAGRGVSGSPRIHAALRAQGIRCARKRVARLMRVQGLCAGRPRRRKPRTTDSQHTQPAHPASTPSRSRPICWDATSPPRRPIARGSLTSRPWRRAVGGSIWPASSTSMRDGPSATRWTATGMSGWWRRPWTWRS
jgi:hypothetical protein